MKRPRHNHGKRSTSRWNARCERKRAARRKRCDDPRVHLALHGKLSPPPSAFLEKLKAELDAIRRDMMEDLELDLLYGTLSPLDRATHKAARRLAAVYKEAYGVG